MSRLTDIAVRPATAFDLDVLALLHEGAFAQSRDQPWNRDAIAALLAMPGAFGLIGLAGGEPTGLAIARVVAGEAELLTLGVLPQARRQGLARLLLGEATSRAAAEGAERIFLEVAEGNLPAQALYAEAGFVQVGRRAGYYLRADGRRAAALVLSLPLVALPGPPL